MSFNLFAWIREGVKQSVLLGVSDALDHIGTTGDGEDPRTRLADLARRTENLPAGETARAESRPKRLGRSLRDAE